MKVDRPVFLVGMPRSGTTILFERLTNHPHVGWPSNYCEMWPGMLAANLLCPLLANRVVGLRGNKKQYGSVRFGNRYLPQPDEAYAFWRRYACADFPRDYLLGRRAGEGERRRCRRAVARLLRYQLKRRFAAKLTGPGRIAYLHSIFPDARFIHVIRDGRAVVHSLLNVSFWRDKGGFEGPFWRGGLSDEAVSEWRRDGDPALLAALQWDLVLRSTRSEARRLDSSQYMEVQFEAFVAAPEKTLATLVAFCDLPTAQSAAPTPSDNAPVTDMSTKYCEGLDQSTIRRITTAMRPLLEELGYLGPA